MHGMGLIAALTESHKEFVDDDIRKYLIIFLIGNAIFEIGKLIMFGCAARRWARDSEHASDWQLWVLVIQTVSNVTLLGVTHLASN